MPGENSQSSSNKIKPETQLETCTCSAPDDFFNKLLGSWAMCPSLLAQRVLHIVKPIDLASNGFSQPLPATKYSMQD
jgi:hypothetical protein